MTRCFIALGSNLGEPLETIESATRSIAALDQCRLLNRSRWYSSVAIGPGDQPDYINGVVAIETTLSPPALLSELQAIEHAHGRQRGQRWAARTLDLDILLYGELCQDDPCLTLPHPRLQERNFVLYPLSELAPDLTLPCGTALGSLLASCSREGLQLSGEMSDPGR